MHQRVSTQRAPWQRGGWTETLIPSQEARARRASRGQGSVKVEELKGPAGGLPRGGGFGDSPERRWQAPALREGGRRRVKQRSENKPFAVCLLKAKVNRAQKTTKAKNRRLTAKDRLA